MKWEDFVKYLIQFELIHFALAIVMSFVEYLLKIVPIISNTGLEPNIVGLFTLVATFAANLLIVKSLFKLLTWIIRKYSHHKTLKREQDSQKQKIEKERIVLENNESQKLEEEIRRIWLWMDSLSNDNHTIVMLLFVSGNQPVQWIQTSDENSIFNSRQIYRNVCRDRKKCEEITSKLALGYINETVYDYQLEDDVFELLKLSYKKYGKISNKNGEQKTLAENPLAKFLIEQ